VEVALLGPVEVQVAEGVVPLTAAKERAVLSLLALRAGYSVSTAGLIDALWGDDPPRSAAKALQNYVANLRRVLPTGVLVTVPGGYKAELNPDQVDALCFEQLVTDAQGTASTEPERAVALLSTGLALWRGAPLVDLAGHAVGMLEINRLLELRRTAEDLVVDARLALGEHEALIGQIEAAVAAEPLRERRWAQLITALYRCGRQADALRTYQRLRLTLLDELGIAPSTGLQALEAAVLAHDPLLDVPRPKGTRTGSANLGGSAPVAGVAPPRALARLVGRQAELDEIAALLLSGCLVTLTGVGGVGKTRLALAVAQAAEGKYPDGVGWAELASVSAPEDVVRTLADALGVAGQPGRPLMETVCDSLQGRRVLAVLDNCEHVREAAAKLATAVGGRCHDVALLATSRERLGVDGERVVEIMPLPVGGADSPAVELLVERIDDPRRGDVDGNTLAEMAERLEGLPLALELAAARCRSLGVAQVASRLAGHFGLLADRLRHPERHRTLEAAMAWSYDLLGPVERDVLQRLSVFNGSFALDGAERVLDGTGLGAVVVDDAVASLVDKSLVVREGNRFRLLETTRQFAADRLGASGGFASALDAHRAYVVERVRNIRDGLAGPEEALWVTTLDAEWADVRAVVRRAFATDDADTATAVIVNFAFEFLFRRPEAFAWVSQAVARYGDRPSPHRHELLAAGCVAAFTLLDVAGALDLAEKALAADPAPGTAVNCLPELAALGAYYFAAQFDRVQELSERTIAVLAPDADPWTRTSLLVGPSWAALGRGRRDDAASMAAIAVAHAEASGHPSSLAYALGAYGLAAATGDPAAAAEMFRRGHLAAGLARNQWLLAQSGLAMATTGPHDADVLVASLEAANQMHRTGWVTHAWMTAWVTPGILYDLNRRDEAALMLGACQASDVPRSIGQALPPDLEMLAGGHGDPHLTAFAAVGARLALPELILIATGSQPVPHLT
jgi:predicted ATPase/DNA-binding SARP family transcriptional activator